MRPTRAGNFALIALPFTLLAGYFIGGVTATAEMHQKQETYNVAYQWCAENTPDPTACQWGAYKVLNP